MALNTPQGWLICYDIANPRRLHRLHRFLVKLATPVQYSVFHFEGTPAAMGQLMLDVETYIDPKNDDVRAYALPRNLSVDTLGKGRASPGIQLYATHSPQLRQLLAASGK